MSQSMGFSGLARVDGSLVLRLHFSSSHTEYRRMGHPHFRVDLLSQ
jgi:hypothetical protein